MPICVCIVAQTQQTTPDHPSQVALLNGGPTGTETLKNLVLGGIAGFTVVDDAKVTAVDLGNNFLVEASSLGEPRAKVGVGQC